MQLFKFSKQTIIGLSSIIPIVKYIKATNEKKVLFIHDKKTIPFKFTCLWYSLMLRRIRSFSIKTLERPVDLKRFQQSKIIVCLGDKTLQDKVKIRITNQKLIIIEGTSASLSGLNCLIYDDLIKQFVKEDKYIPSLICDNYRKKLYINNEIKNHIKTNIIWAIECCLENDNIFFLSLTKKIIDIGYQLLIQNPIKKHNKLTFSEKKAQKNLCSQQDELTYNITNNGRTPSLIIECLKNKNSYYLFEADVANMFSSSIKKMIKILEEDTQFNILIINKMNHLKKGL